MTCLRTTDGSEARLRRRGEGGNFTYAHTVKLPRQQGGNVIERPISGREYFALLAQTDPERRPVRKRRRCFVHENQYMELDDHESPASGLTILQVEGPEEVPPRLPAFLTVEREVTDDPRYTTARIAAGSLGSGC